MLSYFVCKEKKLRYPSNMKYKNVIHTCQLFRFLDTLLAWLHGPFIYARGLKKVRLHVTLYMLYIKSHACVHMWMGKI